MHQNKIRLGHRLTKQVLMLKFTVKCKALNMGNIGFCVVQVVIPVNVIICIFVNLMYYLCIAELLWPTTYLKTRLCTREDMCLLEFTLRVRSQSMPCYDPLKITLLLLLIDHLRFQLFSQEPYLPQSKKKDNLYILLYILTEKEIDVHIFLYLSLCILNKSWNII